MAEDTRLKVQQRGSMLNINLTTNPINRNILIKQFTPKNYFKKHPLNNNIEYTIMDTSQQIVLDYLLSSEKGEILKRNGQELKKLKIGEKTYNFERGNHFKEVDYQVQQD